MGCALLALRLLQLRPHPSMLRVTPAMAGRYHRSRLGAIGLAINLVPLIVRVAPIVLGNRICDLGEQVLFREGIRDPSTLAFDVPDDRLALFDCAKRLIEPFIHCGAGSRYHFFLCHVPIVLNADLGHHPPLL